MKKLIVIPARGGSKGIPGKNIYPINGKPLLAYTIEVILKSNLKDTDVAVSTDSESIRDVAGHYQGVFVIDRPSDISGDSAKTEAALVHALDYMEKEYGKKYEAVLTLQATSPLRETNTLVEFINEFEKKYPAFDAQLSLNENRTDFWIREPDNSFGRLYPDAPRRRQDRAPLYAENSAYYITEVQALKETMSVLGNRANGFVISDEEAIDINEPIDIMIAEALIIKKQKEGNKYGKV